ncbi:MAG: PorP/SprF family type IX secretion system membrane protein [Saprospiraceae bacterium]|nr:PorP/SprF family type IX secretion system membrane protein [Saprospiraceae bacterium]
MRALFTTIIAGLFMLGTDAQTISDWSNDQFLMFSTNPAYTTEVSSLTVGVNHARRWENLSSSPVQSNVAAMIPFSDMRMGMGGTIFSDQIGPFSTVGMGVSYSYRLPISRHGTDYLAMGMSAKLMHVKFDQNHFVAADELDNLLSNVEGNKFVPPIFSVGFLYRSGTPTSNNPVQMHAGMAMTRFFPFQDRFNTLAFDRIYQWFGSAGLSIAATDELVIEPSLLLSDIDRNAVNVGFRVRADFTRLGWGMMQYSKAGFLVTQLGARVGQNWGRGYHLEISGTNSWHFGPISNQLGSSLGFSVAYIRSLDQGAF